MSTLKVNRESSLMTFFIHHSEFMHAIRLALMAVRSNALPLTVSCESLTTAWVSIPPKACEKVASDLGLGGVFLPGTPVSATSYDWLVTTYPQYGRILFFSACEKVSRVLRLGSPFTCVLHFPPALTTYKS